jgi:P2-related tail formation protein
VTTETLLPPNATPLERALETAMRPGADVLAAIELIRTAKEAPPDDWLYFLIWEYGLEELLPYLPDPRVVLQRGLEWQRIRGTPNSIRLAHSWLNLTAGIEEETPGGPHWFEYQLALESVPGERELRNIIGLARISQPVRSRLSRVYHGLDLRRARWDEFKWSDGSLYCADSGVYDPDLDVILSFMRRGTAWSEVGEILSFSVHTSEHAVQARYEDRLIYSFGFYDDLVGRNYPIQTDRETGIIGQGVGRNLLVADGGSGGMLGQVRANGDYIADGSLEAVGYLSFGQQKADGTYRANGRRIEIPQPVANHYTLDFTTETAGWGMVPWDDRTWTGV